MPAPLSTPGLLATALAKRAATRLREQLDATVRYSTPRFRTVGLLGSSAFILYYFIWTRVFPQRYESLALRLIGAAFFASLIFHQRIFQSGKVGRFAGVYYWSGITYSGPFFFSYMLLRNEGSQVWITSFTVSICLIFLVLDIVSAIACLLTGITLAYVIHRIESEVAIFPLTAPDIPVLLFTAIAASAFNFKTTWANRARDTASLLTLESIAHELHTPIATIRLTAQGLRDSVCTLFRESENQNIESALPTSTAPLHSSTQRDKFEGCMAAILQEAEAVNLLLDMVFVSNRWINSNARTANIDCACSMKRCVDIALSRFRQPANHSIEIDISEMRDFCFKGNELLMTHVILNLLRNAVTSITRAGKGTVRIYSAKTGQQYHLLFRDTGSGIPPEILPRIFTKYYSWRPGGERNGLGIGLSFCRDIILAFGGRLTCHSVVGDFTEFRIELPALKSQ